MNLQALTCGHCGAPLDVPVGTSYLTCAHCGSRLKVSRTATAVFTEVLEQISSHTGQMVGQLDTIRLQNELERIDREWQMEQEKYRVRGENGSSSLPDSGSALVGVIFAALAVAFGVFWISQVTSMGAPAFMSFFGVAIVVMAIIGVVSGLTKSSDYQHAEAAYRKRREEILRQLGPGT